jgi:hypothetical protein
MIYLESATSYRQNLHLLPITPFKNGDSIIADVSIKYSDKEGKKNQYVITKVIEHIVAPTQPFF